MLKNVSNGAAAAKAYCPSCALKPVNVAGAQKLSRRPTQAPQGLRPGMAVKVRPAI